MVKITGVSGVEERNDAILYLNQGRQPEADSLHQHVSAAAGNISHKSRRHYLAVQRLRKQGWEIVFAGWTRDD